MLPQRCAARRTDRIPRDRLAILEFLADHQVIRLFQLAKLRAEIAIGFAKCLAQVREAEGLDAAEQHHGAEPSAVLQERIEARQPDRFRRCCSHDRGQCVTIPPHGSPVSG